MTFQSFCAVASGVCFCAFCVSGFALLMVAIWADPLLWSLTMKCLTTAAFGSWAFGMAFKALAN